MSEKGRSYSAVLLALITVAPGTDANTCRRINGEKELRGIPPLQAPPPAVRSPLQGISLRTLHTTRLQGTTACPCSPGGCREFFAYPCRPGGCRELLRSVPADHEVSGNHRLSLQATRSQGVTADPCRPRGCREFVAGPCTPRGCRVFRRSLQTMRLQGAVSPIPAGHEVSGSHRRSLQTTRLQGIVSPVPAHHEVAGNYRRSLQTMRLRGFVSPVPAGQLKVSGSHRRSLQTTRLQGMVSLLYRRGYSCRQPYRAKMQRRPSASRCRATRKPGPGEISPSNRHDEHEFPDTALGFALSRDARA